MGSGANLRLLGMGGFWERFFTVAAHIAFSALTGYGLAKGWGWQFFLIASVLHGLLNYGAVLWQAELLTGVYVEIVLYCWHSCAGNSLGPVAPLEKRDGNG